MSNEVIPFFEAQSMYDRHEFVSPDGSHKPCTVCGGYSSDAPHR